MTNVIKHYNLRVRESYDNRERLNAVLQCQRHCINDIEIRNFIAIFIVINDLS